MAPLVLETVRHLDAHQTGRFAVNQKHGAEQGGENRHQQTVLDRVGAVQVQALHNVPAGQHAHARKGHHHETWRAREICKNPINRYTLNIA